MFLKKKRKRFFIFKYNKFLVSKFVGFYYFLMSTWHCFFEKKLNSYYLNVHKFYQKINKISLCKNSKLFKKISKLTPKVAIFVLNFRNITLIGPTRSFNKNLRLFFLRNRYSMLRVFFTTYFFSFFKSNIFLMNSKHCLDFKIKKNYKNCKFLS